MHGNVTVFVAKAQTSLSKAGIEIMSAHAFLRFQSSLDSEWIWFEWLDETTTKFWFHNTCEKAKSDI